MKKKRIVMLILKLGTNEILLKMKLLTLMLFVAFVSASASSYSQATKFNLEMRDVSIGEVFQKIEEQSEFVILFNEKTFDIKRKVNVDVKNKTVDNILDQIFDGDKEAYKIFDHQIAIFANEIKELTSSSKVEIKAEQKKEISGTVKDAKGLPLPGTTVIVKGTTTGAIADNEGKFTLKIPGDGKVLVFSFVGMKTKEVQITGLTTINMVMEEANVGLDEVVAIGYGSIRRKDLTGSVGSVNMADMEKAPVASFSDALAGRVAGVQVSSNDGQPGSEMKIVIRGANSLTQNNDPLFVIDGFPLEDFESSALNPKDIESINILKDASATAIYGARGANGVVVIETKKGTISKPTISINSSIGYQELHKKMKMMSPYEFVNYQYELYPSTAEARYFTNGKTLDSFKEIKGIDWQDQIFGRAPMQIHEFSIRGGNTQTKYSISGSIYDQSGVINNSSFKRYQGRMSIDQVLSKKLKAGFIANYSKSTAFGAVINQGAGTNVSTALFYRAWGYRPVTGYDLDLLDQESDPDNINVNDIRLNPVITNNNEYSSRVKGNLLVNAYLSYAITNDLTLKTTGSINSRQGQNDLFYNSKTVQGSPLNINNVRGVNGSVDYSFGDIWSNENILTYQKIINKVHKIMALGGFSMQGNKTWLNGSSSQNVPNEELGIDGLDEGTPYAIRAARSSSTMASIFGRLNYDFNSKYQATATFRGDGSSKLAPGKKWGYFPSAAFAWNMDKEEFLRLPAFIFKSKIRASYGVTGNNRVSDFAYLSILNLPIANSYSFNNGIPQKGVIPKQLGNEDLKWESTSQLNIGYDLGLFNNKAEFTVDWYRKRTHDLLLNANIPVTTGYSSIFRNIGEVQNQGLELSASTTNIDSKLFKWTSNFNISFNNNKVLELVKGQEALYSIATFSGSFSNPLYVARVGQPMGMFYGVIFDGVYQYADFDNPAPGVYILKNSITTNGNPRNMIQPGDIKYQDLNGDGVINGYDMTVIGRGLPVHTGGFANNFTYKGFSLNAFLQWSYGNQVYNANRIMLEGNVLTYRDLNQFASYTDRWTPENPTNKNFRAGGQGPNSFHSTRVLEDGSYLRLKTLTISYSFPTEQVKKYYFTGLTVNVSAQNLVTWTKYSGMDPEVSVLSSVLMPGFDWNSYPQARTITLGLNLTF